MDTASENAISAAQLHDRATRGEVLDAAEQDALQHWYRAQDAAEAQELAAHRSPVSAPPHSAVDRPSVPDLPDLLSAIRATVDRIEALSQQNAALRDEIRELQLRLPLRAA